MRSKNSMYFLIIEELFDDYTGKNEKFHTIREIQSAVSMGLGTVSRHLSRMRENGLLDYAGCCIITAHEKRITRNEINKASSLVAYPALS